MVLQPCNQFIRIPTCSCLPCGILVGKKSLYLDVTIVFLVYMDKIVCRNSGSNKEVIREKYRLGGNRGGTMYITQQLLANTRNNQY